MNKTKKLPRGAMSDAARRLNIPRQYVLQVVRGKYSDTDRCLEILKIVEECADARFQKRRAEKNLREELKRKYNVEMPPELAKKLADSRVTTDSQQQAAN